MTCDNCLDKHDCCRKGYIMSGKPQGEETVIAGLDAYVSRPENYDGKAVLICSDIFGWTLPNTRIIADWFAKAGFLCILPDFFKGGAVKSFEEYLSMINPNSQTPQVEIPRRTLGEFIATYNKDFQMDLARKVIVDLKDQNKEWKVQKLGSIGYCWGGRHSNLLAGGEQPSLVEAAVMCHPSLVQVPEEIEHIDRPTLWLLAEIDNMFTDAHISKAKEVFEKKGMPFEMLRWPGTEHGFACRGDEAEEVVRKAREEVFDAAVAFFKKHL